MRIISGISILLGNFIFAQLGNFGINTDTPSAKVDIISKDNSNLFKALRVSNSNLQEELTVLSNGNVGVNSTSPNGQVEINSDSNAKSVLKINTLSTTNGRQITAVNYNVFSPVMSDENGYLFTQVDPKLLNINALTFDGNYTTSGATNKILCPINTGSIIGFIVHTGFVQGQNGIGVVKYATVTWSRGTGFIITSSGHDFAGNTSNTLTITGSGTNVLTFDVQTGDDLIFEATGGNLVYRQVDSSTGTGRSESLGIFKSFRSRY